MTNGSGTTALGLGAEILIVKEAVNLCGYTKKKLMFPVNIKKTDPKLAKIMLEQYGGPYGKFICIF